MRIPPLLISLLMALAEVSIARDVFNDRYFPCLHCQAPLQIFYGGSSSGKSAFGAQSRIENFVNEPRNYLIVRKVADTLGSSIFSETKKAISQFHLDQDFKITESPMEITYRPDNRKMYFRGLDNVEKLKSIIVPNGIITDIDIEEATELTLADFEQLELRLRGLSPVVKRMRFFFNPIMRNHWICKRFFGGKWITYKYVPNEILILHTTHIDNRFLTEQDRKKIESKTGYYYDVYAKGKWGVLGNLIFTNWSIADLSAVKEKFSTYRFGGDFGFTNDPTAIVRFALDKQNKTIYWLDEIYERGLTNQHILVKAKDLVGKNVIWWDCAEPKSIMELQIGFGVNGSHYSMNAEPVKKGKDSVIFGLQWLQQWKHVVDKNLANSINELSSFQWMKNKEGDPINQPLEVNDHAITAARYAFEQDMLLDNDMGMYTGSQYYDENHQQEHLFETVVNV